ncbi:MAG: response regulator [Candidatus Nitrosotenuis sp.]
MAAILVAEDSVAYGVLYQEIFQTKGHTVKLTFDGQECLQEYTAQPKRYDLVILDYMMPKKNGFDTAKEILAMNPHQKILFISSFGDELESKIADLGWDNTPQFVEKPFSSVDLVQKAEKLLESEAKITT